MNLLKLVEETLEQVREDGAGKTWVKDPSVKGGGFWRERKPGAKKVEHPNSKKIAKGLIESEKMMEGDDMDAAFDKYEESYAKVNDKNRIRVRNQLKKAGSKMEVMSNNT
jgi:hypothetical protein